MADYGKAALRAIELINTGVSSSPVDSWWIAVAEVFAHSPSSQTKGCPRGAFLGLCSSGAIKGIPAGNYTNSKKNRAYAICALDIIRKTPSLANDNAELWKLVLSGEPKVHNQQMDVVTSLWRSGKISG